MTGIHHIMPPVTGRTVPPLSYAARAGDLLFVSGLPGYEADGTIAKGDFARQFHCVIATLKGVLVEAGVDMRRIVKVNVLLTRVEDVVEMNRLYAEAFGPAPYPARTTSVVLALPRPELMLEIECVVYLG
jgi:enamine deaminase RidA (YjgF/YER057c/UK114 family)